MSLANVAAMGAMENQATNAYQNSVIQSSGTGVTMPGGVATWVGQPLWNEDNHVFNCQKVENGWTLQYRNKNYIAADLDSLMDQMKAAMVLERIDK